METQIKPIKRAVEIMGSALNLANAIGCHRSTIYKWTCPVNNLDHIYCTPEQAIKIEKATRGKVTREEICPHLYDK